MDVKNVERVGLALRKLLREEGAIPLSLVASGNETYARDVRGRFEPSEMGEFEEAWATAQRLAVDALGSVDPNNLPRGWHKTGRGNVWANDGR